MFIRDHNVCPTIVVLAGVQSVLRSTAMDMVSLVVVAVDFLAMARASFHRY